MVTSAQVQRQPLTGIDHGYLAVGVLICVGVGLYSSTIRELVADWWSNPDYSFGLLIPFVVGFSIWQKRHELYAFERIPSGWGVLLALASQVMYLVGYLGAEFFLQRISLLLFAAGSIVCLFGWKPLAALRFECFLVLLSIPVPVIIFNYIALPLQLLASSVAEWILRICSIPVFREGNILQLPFQVLNVTEACSGIRSLISLIALAVAIAHFSVLRLPWRGVFVLSSVPIAIGANVLRVAGTGILANTFGVAAAQGFFHVFTGWCVFVTALLFMQLEMAVLSRLFGEQAAARASS